jgi:hypothetical protein
MNPNTLNKFKNLKKKKNKHEKGESKSYEGKEKMLGTEKEYRKGGKKC